MRRLLSRLVGVCLGRLVLGDGVDVNGVPLGIFPRSGGDDGIRLFVNSSCQCSLQSRGINATRDNRTNLAAIYEILFISCQLC